MRKIKELEGKKYLWVNDNILNKKLDKIKETIAIEKFDDSKFLFDTNDKLPYILL